MPGGIDQLERVLGRAPREEAPVQAEVIRDEPALDDTADLPAIRVTEVSYGRQASQAFAHAWRIARHQVREGEKREGTWWQEQKTTRKSLQDVCDYAQSRAWVPPGHDGGIAEKAGVLYFAVIGRLGAAIGFYLVWKYERPLRWLLVNVVRTALILTVLVLLGHARIAEYAGGAIAAVTVILGAVLAPRRSELEVEDDEEGDDLP